MEQCNFCEKLIEPEKEERLESWGIIRTFHCPKCNMFLRNELNGFNKQKKGLIHIGEILKKRLKAASPEGVGGK